MRPQKCSYLTPTPGVDLWVTLAGPADKTVPALFMPAGRNPPDEAGAARNQRPLRPWLGKLGAVGKKAGRGRTSTTNRSDKPLPRRCSHQARRLSGNKPGGMPPAITATTAWVTGRAGKNSEAPFALPGSSLETAAKWLLMLHMHATNYCSVRPIPTFSPGLTECQ